MTPREQSLKALATFASNMTPSKLSDDPDIREARAVIQDLEALARMVDNVVEAYGEYVISAYPEIEQQKGLFGAQLEGTLTGNALFVIEEAARKKDDERREKQPWKEGGFWRSIFPLTRRERAGY